MLVLVPGDLLLTSGLYLENKTLLEFGSPIKKNMNADVIRLF